MAQSVYASQVVAEVLREIPPSLRTSQVVVEVLHDIPNEVRTSQVVVEVMRKLYEEVEIDSSVGLTSALATTEVGVIAAEAPASSVGLSSALTTSTRAYLNIPSVSGDITLLQGASFSQTFCWKDSDNTAVNTEEYSIRMQIRNTFESTTTIASSTSTPATIAIQKLVAAGYFRVTISSVATTLMDFIRAVYDIEMYRINAPTEIYRPFSGRVYLSREVTR